MKGLEPLTRWSCKLSRGWAAHSYGQPLRQGVTSILLLFVLPLCVGQVCTAEIWELYDQTARRVVLYLSNPEMPRASSKPGRVWRQAGFLTQSAVKPAATVSVTGGEELDIPEGYEIVPPLPMTPLERARVERDSLLRELDRDRPTSEKTAETASGRDLSSRELSRSGDVQVKGHWRGNSWVRPHTRARPRRR